MIWGAAAILGIDPGPYTCRELVEMRKACELNDWDHTAYIVATIAGIFDRSASIEKYHPLRKRETTELTPEALVSLKGSFPEWSRPY